MQLPLTARPAPARPRGADDGARAACIEAIDRGAASAPLLTRLASATHRGGNLPDAIAAAFASCLAKPHDATRLSDLGALCEEAGLSIEAIVAYQAALNANPLHARARSRLWLAHQRVRAGEDAERIAEAAASRMSGLLRQGAFPQALRLAAEVEELLPGVGAADLLKGAVFERQGRYEEAMRAYTEAERFDHDRARYALERVRVKEHRSRQLRAWPIVREIEQRLEAGDDEAAARAGVRLMSLVPDVPAPYLLWARVAERKGSFATAVKNLAQALHLASWGCEAIARKLRTLTVLAESQNRAKSSEEAAEVAS
jgi:tetratricopeptide (TPR) repeat protein